MYSSSKCSTVLEEDVLLVPLSSAGGASSPSFALARPARLSLVESSLRKAEAANMAAQDDTKEQRLAKFKTDLHKLVDKTLVKGDAWFLVDNHWFKQAKRYLAWEGSLADSGGTVGDESANPGPIDNKPLWKEDGSDIREHMIDEMDYVLVPEEAWDMLVAEFGLQDNVEGTSSAVKRKVVEHGMFVKQFKVEVYFIEFQLAENSNLEETKKQKFSKSDTLEQIQEVMKGLFSIPLEEETRLWNKYTSNTYEQLSRLDNGAGRGALPRPADHHR